MASSSEQIATSKDTSSSPIIQPESGTSPHSTIPSDNQDTSNIQQSKSSSPPQKESPPTILPQPDSKQEEKQPPQQPQQLQSDPSQARDSSIESKEISSSSHEQPKPPQIQQQQQQPLPQQPQPHQQQTNQPQRTQQQQIQNPRGQQQIPPSRQSDFSLVSQNLENHMSQALSQVGNFVQEMLFPHRSDSMNSSSISGELSPPQSRLTRPQSSTSSTTGLDLNQDKSVLREIAAGKKQTIFQQLREWDITRTNTLNIHRNILESILARIDQRMKQSQDNLTGITAFIRSITNSISSNLPTPLTQANPSNPHNPPSQQQLQHTQQPATLGIQRHIYSEIYGKLFEAITMYETSALQKRELILTFKARVDAEILATIIAPDAETYTRTITRIRGNLNNLKQSLLEQQSIVTKKSKSLRDVYAANSISPLTNKRPKKDFQKKLYTFLHVCQDLKNIQCVVAKATIGYWRKAIELEKTRAKSIKDALHLLLTLHDDLIVKQAGISTFITPQISAILQQQEFTEDYITEKMGFHEIVSVEDQLFIVKELEKTNKRIKINFKPSSQLSQQPSENQTTEEKASSVASITSPSLSGSIENNDSKSNKDVSIGEVQSYLSKINYSEFDDTGLSQKKLQVKRECTNKAVKQSTVVITPDSFLICYDAIPIEQDNEEESDGSSNTDPHNHPNEESKEAIENRTFEDSQPLYMLNPDVCFPIQQVKLKRNGLTLEVKSSPTSSIMSLIRQTSGDVKLTFKSTDQMEEFISVLISAAYEPQ